MKIKDLDELAYPRRKPWWVLLALLVVAAIFIFRHFHESKPVEKPVVRPPEVAAPDAASPAVKVDQTIALDATNLPPDIQDSVTRAMAAEKEGRLLEARDAYAAARETTTNAGVRRGIEDRLGKVNMELILNPHAMPEKEDYSVRPGDSIDKIAKRFKTTRELIIASNRITQPDTIKAGDRLRVYTGQFRVEVSKSLNELVLYSNDKFVRRYIVGTGQYGRTPVGTFAIDVKQVNPDWWTKGRKVPYGEPENILGTRWMSIRATEGTPMANGYGIHGTADPSTLGQALSAGCVRMRNEEVEELYTILPPGTLVTIVE
jgi:lipoprotein-anchoring transpeptidase ErfK/SrfK